MFAVIIFMDSRTMMIDEKMTEFRKIAIAVSGGRDSMALLRLAMDNREKGSFYVVNIEHGIRGEESLSDSEFVSDFCRKNGIDCRVVQCDVPRFKKENSMTLEQAAREMRHAVLRQEVIEKRADRVALAHHKDDNAESILMHILRGSGIRGLKGMDYDNGVFIRPLLDVTREDIDRYIQEKSVPYREDSTNNDTAYMRNYLRHEIMPLIKKRFPNVLESISRLSKNAEESQKYITDIALEYVELGENYALIDTKSVDDTVFKQAVYLAFCHLNVTADVEARHYSMLLDLKDATAGVKVNMPHGILAVKEYGKISLTPIVENEECDIAFSEGMHEIGAHTLKVERVNASDIDYSLVNSGKRVLFASGDSLVGSVIRMRKKGDTFRSFGGHTKSLSDYLTDKKIPLRLRDMPLIAKGNEVLLISGEEISSTLKINANTTLIYKITLIK